MTEEANTAERRQSVSEVVKAEKERFMARTAKLQALMDKIVNRDPRQHPGEYMAANLNSMMTMCAEMQADWAKSLLRFEQAVAEQSSQ